MTDPKYMRRGLNFARGKAIEEAGELLAALGKSLRWGWDSTNPELPEDQRETNAEWVCREMADVRGALDNLETELKCWRRRRPEESPMIEGPAQNTDVVIWKSPGDNPDTICVAGGQIVFKFGGRCIGMPAENWYRLGRDFAHLAFPGVVPPPSKDDPFPDQKETPPIVSRRKPQYAAAQLPHIDKMNELRSRAGWAAPKWVGVAPIGMIRGILEDAGVLNLLVDRHMQVERADDLQDNLDAALEKIARLEADNPGVRFDHPDRARHLRLRALIAQTESSAPVTIDYTNHRGERRVRNIIPVGSQFANTLYFGSSPWHTGQQWLLSAQDTERRTDSVRSFALAGIHEWDGETILSDQERKDAGK